MTARTRGFRTQARRGNVLAVVLIVMLALFSTVAALQYQVASSLRSVSVAFRTDANSHRAEGLLRMLVSRWKKAVALEPGQPLALAASGRELGRWDGQAHEVFWQWESAGLSPSRERLVTWLRFPGDPAGRVYRYELLALHPSALRPRALRVTGSELVSMDPADDTQRQRDFERTRPPADPAAAARAQVAAELATFTVPALAEAGQDEPRVRQAVAAAVAGAAPLIQVLTAHETYRRETNLDLRLQHLTAMSAAAGNLTEPLRTPWLDLADYLQAREEVRRGRLTGGTAMRDALDRAGRLLDGVLARGSCCSEAAVVWLRRQIGMIARSDWGLSGPLETARSGGAADLQARARGREDDPIHSETDITWKELSPLFESLWVPRVALGVKLASGRHAALTILPDGRPTHVEMESSRPLKPLAWSGDGGSLIVSGGASGLTHAAWEVRDDGAPVDAVVRTFAVRDDTSGTLYDHVFRDLILARHTRDGGPLLVSGTVQDAGSAQRLAERGLSPELLEGSAARTFLGRFSEALAPGTPAFDQLLDDASNLPRPEPGSEVIARGLAGYFDHRSFLLSPGQPAREVSQFNYVFMPDRTVWSRNLNPPAVSPDGRLLARVTYVLDNIYSPNQVPSHSQLELWLHPVDAPTFMYARQWVTPVPDGVRLHAVLPAQQPDHLLTGLDWKTIAGTDWLAWADLPAKNPGPAVVRFVKTDVLTGAPAVPEVVPVDMVVDEHRDPRVFGRVSSASPMGQLIASPPGYLIAGKEALQYVPLPGTPLAARSYPIAAGGAVAEVRHLSVPDGSDRAYFTARIGGGKRQAFALDLRTGATTPVAGAGGALLEVDEVLQLSTSPLPGR